MSVQTPLFRAEVMRFRADRLHGTVSLATPLAWHLIGALLLAALCIALAFLTMASYARVETVGGAITLDTGVATILPSRTGTVDAIAVREGQAVRAGDLLMRIRAEEDLSGGQTAPERIRAALEAQDARLAAQANLLGEAGLAEQERLRSQIAGLAGEIGSIEQQLADQQHLVRVAESEFHDVQRVAANGFISRRDLEAREATLLLRRQQLSQLEQQRTSKRSALAEAQRAIAQSGAASQAQIASAQSNRAALTQQIAQADLSRGYALNAPVDGVVTALTGRLGQPATLQQPLMMIVPAKARTRVELQVPTAAAGFLAPGQEVRLAVDAYPYQRFGTVVARISDVSTAAVARQGPNGAVPVYLVTAELARPWVEAFGRRQRLLPGMTLTARIVTEKRSLIEWLFEPLFAVRNR